MTERVLVTGISGFIALHVAAELLRAGKRVRGTVRSLARADEVRQALAGVGVDASGIEFVAADLTADAGWREAVEGCAFVQHVASPFPISQPRQREALTPAAREGALRVVRAALESGAERVVVTSSMVAMMYRANRPARFAVGETDWTDPDWGPATPYIISKTRAERAVWELARNVGAESRVVAVNPGFVLGPALSGDINTSIGVVQLIMRGAYPALPPIAFPVVDVRDLASVQVAAMRAPVGGRRLIAARDTLSMREMALTLKKAFPTEARKAPTSELPASAVRALALLDPTLKTVLPDLSAIPTPDSAYVSALTGVTFRDGADAVIAAGRSLIELGALNA